MSIVDRIRVASNEKHAKLNLRPNRVLLGDAQWDELRTTEEFARDYRSRAHTVIVWNLEVLHVDRGSYFEVAYA